MRRVLPLLLVCLLAPHVFGRQPAPVGGDDRRPFLHQLFTDHVVLQRGVRFPVWGWTTPGARVGVRMNGREASAVADAQGKWTARLGPFEAGGPHTLTVQGPQSVTLKDVLIGDVWLASGQSNMEMGITQVSDANDEVAAANHPLIRLFAVTIDIGDAKDIHPKNKLDVGERLALVALAKVYGRKLEYSGPVYRRMKVEGERVRLTFDHAGGGLLAKGGALKGFAVAGEDGRFVWAEASIEDDEVVVWSPQVKRPAAVRYGWADNPEGNLYNRAGLPASPFRTDDFPSARQ
jgi:hypothetical protein